MNIPLCARLTSIAGYGDLLQCAYSGLTQPGAEATQFDRSHIEDDMFEDGLDSPAVSASHLVCPTLWIDSDTASGVCKTSDGAYASTPS